MEEIFSNRCRACRGLQECSEKMISLFDKNLSEMFTHCTSLEVAAEDCLPSRICFECYGHLSNFNKFRENCVNSDAYFREQIVTESIKVEPLIGVKYEEIDPNRDIGPDFYDTEYIDEDFSQYDPEIREHNAVTSTVNTDSNASSDRTTKYICDYCGQTFGQKSHIGSHMTKHKNEMLVETRSKTLPRKSLNDHKLKSHKKQSEHRDNVVTDEEKKVKFCCTQCPKWFTMQIKLDAHIRGTHEGLKPYKCSQKDCVKEFVKYRSYNNHLRFRHSTMEHVKYKCTYDGCDKEYFAAYSLKTHINRNHLGIVPVRKNQSYICEQCGRTFTNGCSLKEHSYIHSGTLPFACKMCPKKFISKYKLKIHMMRHLNDKPFVCPTCGLRKTTNKELQIHLNFHSKAITYPCKECPRVFTSYAASNRHVRIHHRNHKPYICPHCQRAFSKADTMKNHVMTHTGEKPFACSVCGHRFIQGVALKAHMKVHAKKS